MSERQTKDEVAYLKNVIVFSNISPPHHPFHPTEETPSKPPFTANSPPYLALIACPFSAPPLFSGGKTIAYRQIGNAFPPPVACVVGKAILKAFKNMKSGYDVTASETYESRLFEAQKPYNQLKKIRRKTR